MKSELVILADGGLLHARNVRARERSGAGVGAVLDYTKIPAVVAAALGMPAPSKTTCHWFMIGSASAARFVETISSTWTPQEFPLRAFADDSGQVSFTPLIAWALGNVANNAPERTTVVVSNDPGVVFPAKFTIDRGVARVFLAWPDALPEEARYFADRNQVPVLPIDASEFQAPSGKPSFGKTFLTEPATKEFLKKET